MSDIDPPSISPDESFAAFQSDQTAPGTATEELPRLWTAFVFFVAVLLAVLVGSVLLLVAVFAATQGTARLSDGNAVRAYAMTPGFLLIAIYFTALVLVPASLLAARLSPVPWRQRLSLGPSGASWPVLLAAMVGAPALGGVLEGVMGLLGVEYSGVLRDMQNSMAGATGWELPVLIIGISVGPGLGEELVFRGYIQTRLLQRFRPFVAILIASILFGVMHLDVQHSTLAGILGCYLGLLAYRFGSIRPAIWAHGFNNFLSALGMTVFASAEEEAPFDPWSGALSLAVFVVCLFVVLRFSKRPSSAEPTEAMANAGN